MGVARLPSQRWGGSRSGCACRLLTSPSDVSRAPPKLTQVPLRYMLEYRSSRSQVKDAALDQAIYPLYRKGVERERFDAAVMLLRKDIQQLLFARSVIQI